MLTPQQKMVIEDLKAQGAFTAAEAAENAWQRGQSYYLDSRLDVPEWLRTAFNKANRRQS